ncbi:MAG TPA: histidine kinase dimerization/phospho-acceptor domain-containing protein, partial [Magnetospirillum sp.]|nr:histidine kinase dimerization/phospho-acceptor domain-containing protein [Magnetospirillum sp.]
MAAPSAIVDATGRLAEANSAFACLVGQATDALPGQAAIEVLEGLPVSLDKSAEALVHVRRTRKTASPLMCSVAPLPSGGAVLTLSQMPQGCPHDSIIEVIHEGITIRTADGGILCNNRAARALLGDGGTPEFVRWDGAPLETADAPDTMALESGNPVAAVVGVRQPDDRVKWLHVHSVPIVHPRAGRVVVSSYSEADPLKEAQRRLADTEFRFRAIFDQTHEVIGLLDVEGHLLEANATALAFIDKGLDEIAGLPFAETPWWAHSAAERERLSDGIRRAAAGEFVRFEATHPAPDGSALTIDFSLKPVYGSNGRVHYIIPEGREITHIKRTEEALRAAKLEAEAASRAKSSFLASVSHELRTPLNAVIGFSETMQEQVFGPLGNDRYAEYVKLIRDAGCHLRDVIEDILDVARIEVGEMMLHEEVMDLGECLDGTLRMIGQRADQRRVGLELEAERPLPRLKADPLRIRQVLLNLLSNAVKFTP